MTVLALLTCLASFSQSSLQLGASGVFSKTKGFGGEIAGNAQMAKNLSVGLGVKPIKFEEHGKLYIPVFATLKYYYPLPKWRLFASFDPGYGIYSSEDPSGGFYSLKRTGALYLSGGVGIMGAARVAPYASIHFTKFGFTEHAGLSSQYRPISTLTFTAGLVLNKLTSKNIFDREKPAPLQSGEYYAKRSKNRKKTAWILLGSGAALFVGGIAVATQQKDEIEAGVSLVLISGAGVVTSLVSIPFFVSANINKRKAMNISSYLEMQKSPVKMQSRSLNNSYPALAVKLNF
jgi:hypothetical protein